MQLGTVARTIEQSIARAAIELVACRLMPCEWLAQDRLVALAIEAMSAVRVPRAHHVIARCDLRDGAAHTFDDARAFVAEHDRQGIDEAALHDLEIGVAKAARTDAHQDVEWFEWGQQDLLDRQGLIDRVKDRRFELHRWCIPRKQNRPRMPLAGAGLTK